MYTARAVTDYYYVIKLLADFHAPPGVDVMITIFSAIFGEKMYFTLKTNVRIQIFPKTAVFKNKKNPAFFQISAIIFLKS
jgi:hypothetical protein